MLSVVRRLRGIQKMMTGKQGDWQTDWLCVKEERGCRDGVGSKMHVIGTEMILFIDFQCHNVSFYLLDSTNRAKSIFVTDSLAMLFFIGGHREKWMIDNIEPDDCLSVQRRRWLRARQVSSGCYDSSISTPSVVVLFDGCADSTQWDNLFHFISSPSSCWLIFVSSSRWVVVLQSVVAVYHWGHLNCKRQLQCETKREWHLSQITSFTDSLTESATTVYRTILYVWMI